MHALADADPNLSPRSSPPSSPTSSRYASFAQTAINSPTQTIRSLPSNGFIPAFSGLSLTPSKKSNKAQPASTVSDAAGYGTADEDEEAAARKAPPVDSHKQPAAKDEDKPPHDHPVRGALASAAQGVLETGGAALNTLASPISLADDLLHRRAGGRRDHADEAAADGSADEGGKGRDVTNELDVDERAKEEQYEDPGDDVRRRARAREAKMATNSPAMERTESALALPPHAENAGGEWPPCLPCLGLARSLRC